MPTAKGLSLFLPFTSSRRWLRTEFQWTIREFMSQLPYVWYLYIAKNIKCTHYYVYYAYRRSNGITWYPFHDKYDFLNFFLFSSGFNTNWLTFLILDICNHAPKNKIWNFTKRPWSNIASRTTLSPRSKKSKRIFLPFQIRSTGAGSSGECQKTYIEYFLARKGNGFLRGSTGLFIGLSHE